MWETLPFQVPFSCLKKKNDRRRIKVGTVGCHQSNDYIFRASERACVRAFDGGLLRKVGTNFQEKGERPK